MARKIVVTAVVTLPKDDNRKLSEIRKTYKDAFGASYIAEDLGAPDAKVKATVNEAE